MVLAQYAMPTSARPLPSISGDETDQHCRTALSIAQEAFRSTSSEMVWPVSRPEEGDGRLELARALEDISGGTGTLSSENDAFGEMYPDNNYHYPAVIYWQKSSFGGKRLALRLESYGWRGLQYELHLVNVGLRPIEFRNHWAASNPTELPADSSDEVLLPESWNPPLILSEPNAPSRLWAIGQGEPRRPMIPWNVVTMDSANASKPCHIVFVPQGEAALDRLPAEVRKFANLVDATLGYGPESGTLQPINRTRGRVLRDWEIVGVRPWALTDRPYNSRAEVETGLAKWAAAKPSQAAHLRRIKRSYAPAQASLANYYIREFDLPPDAARQFSAYAIDHMFRQYFVFHSDESYWNFQRVVGTPWPRDIR